jgi:hypothetical protein
VAWLEEYFGEWKPISRYAGIGWICVYVLFLAYAAGNRTGFLFLDFANLMIHECGHPLFSVFGYTMMIMGGTLLELIVPLACAGYFLWKREISGTAFCVFWFFENFPYIGTYMADARARNCRWLVRAITTGESCLGNGDCCCRTRKSAELRA